MVSHAGHTLTSSLPSQVEAGPFAHAATRPLVSWKMRTPCRHKRLAAVEFIAFTDCRMKLTAEKHGHSFEEREGRTATSETAMFVPRV